MRPERTEIIRAARSLLGVPFRHLGRDPKDALDCIGFVLAVGSAVGADLPSEIPLYRTAGPVSFAKSLLFEWTDPTDIWWGSVLLLSVENMPRHFAIGSCVSGYRSIIHACVFRNRVVEHGLSDERILAVRSFRWSR